MRKKDASKKEALFRATQQIVIEEGFAKVSMSKIAKAANVAPATLYTYFENKDDLLDELFMMLHIELMEAVKEDFADFKSYEKWFRKIWKNLYEYLLAHPDDFAFCQQFQASPRMRHLCLKDDCDAHSGYMVEIIESGQKEGAIKKLPKEAMHAFVFLPVIELVRMELGGIVKINRELFQRLEDLAWEIISVK